MRDDGKIECPLCGGDGSIYGNEARAQELRRLRNVLKSGDYNGVDLMHAWIALEAYADALDGRDASRVDGDT